MNIPLDQHYASVDIVTRINEAVRQLGRTLESLTRDELSGFDEFHIGGREQTRQLAELTQLRANECVLDLGAGVGGPARTLASEFGVHVTAVDLTESFCQTAHVLNRIVGLHERINCLCADASSLPFEADSFDVVWMQHLTANVADKPRLFQGCRRVLRTGGRLALHEVVSGDGAPIHLPVFWASEARHNHLLPEDDLVRTIVSAGFEIGHLDDVSAEAIEFFRSAHALPKEKRPKLGPPLIIPFDPGRKAANVLRNLEAGRIRIVRGVCRAV